MTSSNSLPPLSGRVYHTLKQPQPFLARGPASFLALRFLLGVAEAGFFPGIVLYLTYWYPARERARVMAMFYLGIPIAFVIGSPVSSSLLNMNGFAGLRGWQWLFIIEGLPAALQSFVVLRFLTIGRKRPSGFRPKSVRRSLSLGWNGFVGL